MVGKNAWRLSRRPRSRDYGYRVRTRVDMDATAGTVMDVDTAMLTVRTRHREGHPPAHPVQSAVIFPQCKMANSQGARFCSQCATLLVPAACGKCDSAPVAAVKFRSQCGTAAT